MQLYGIPECSLNGISIFGPVPHNTQLTPGYRGYGDGYQSISGFLEATSHSVEASPPCAGAVRLHAIAGGGFGHPRKGHTGEREKEKDKGTLVILGLMFQVSNLFIR